MFSTSLKQFSLYDPIVKSPFYSLTLSSSLVLVFKLMNNVLESILLSNTIPIIHIKWIQTEKLKKKNTLFLQFKRLHLLKF